MRVGPRRLTGCVATLRLNQQVSWLLTQKIQERLLARDSASSLGGSSASRQSKTTGETSLQSENEALLSWARRCTRDCFLDLLMLKLVPLAEFTDELAL